MNIGKRVKNLRKLKGLTLQQLADKVDLSVSYLSDIENNRSNPSLQRLSDIAGGLGTSVSYLLGETMEEPSKNMYTVDKIDLLNEVLILLKDPYFKSLFPYLQEVKSWNSKDKKELVTYLKIKSMLNNYKE